MYKMNIFDRIRCYLMHKMDFKDIAFNIGNDIYEWLSIGNGIYDNPINIKIN